MNYKKWLFIAVFSLFSFLFIKDMVGYFLGRWKDAENCIFLSFFEKCTFEDSESELAANSFIKYFSLNYSSPEER